MRTNGRVFKIIAGILLALIGLMVVAIGCFWLFQYIKEDAEPVAVVSNIIRPAQSQAASSESAPASPSSTGESSAKDASSEAESSSAVYKEGIVLHKSNPQDNLTFEVAGMLPGDRVTRDYEVKVYHKGKARLSFGAEVTDEQGALSGALRVRVLDLSGGNKLLYDGLVKDLDKASVSEELPAVTAGESLRRFRLEVYLPVETGNAYQQNRLKADWIWEARGIQGGSVSPVPTGDRPLLPAVVLALGFFCTGAGLLILGKSRIGRQKQRKTVQR